jgi:hypothetical protein
MDCKPQQGAKKDGDMMQRWFEEAATDAPFNTIGMVAVAQIEMSRAPDGATSSELIRAVFTCLFPVGLHSQRISRAEMLAILSYIPLAII